MNQFFYKTCAILTILITVFTVWNTVSAETISVGGSVSVLTASSTKVYALSSNGDTFSIIDTANNNSVTTIQVGAYPIAFTTLGNKVYVANQNSNSVSIIDTANNNSVTTVNVASNPRDIAAINNKVYVAGVNSISVIDTVNNNSVTTLNVSSANRLVALNNKVYVTQGINSVSIIDTANNNSVTTVNVASAAIGIVALNNKVYVSNYSSNKVSIIDTANNNSVTTVNVGSFPNPLTTLGNKVYVANNNSNNVSIIDTANNNSVTTIQVGGAPTAFTTLGNKVYVANNSDTTVSIIDAANNNSVRTIQVGGYPQALTTLGNKLYVARGNVLIVDITPPSLQSFTSSNTANGTYGGGSTINIYANFNQNIDSGSVNVTLNTGATLTLNHISGTQVYGTYTVSPGETTNGQPLNVTSINSMSVANYNGTTSTTTLPNQNIASSSSVIIDTTTPVLQSFTTNVGSGTYGGGSTININANFDQQIDSGSVDITLSSGATLTLNQVSGNQVYGTYTVSPVDTTNGQPLAVTSINSISVVNGNGTTSTTTFPDQNIASSTSVIIDTTPPILQSFTTDVSAGIYEESSGIHIFANFNHQMGGGQINVTLNTGATLTLDEGRDTSVYGTYTVQSGDTTNDQPLAVTSINYMSAIDLYGNQTSTTTLPDQNIASSTSVVIDALPAKVVSTAVNSGNVALIFNKPLNESSIPQASDFSININGSTYSARTIGISGKLVTLQFTPAVLPTDTVSVSYAQGDTPLLDNYNRSVLDFNNSTTTSDTLAASLISFSAPDGDGAYSQDDDISIYATFDDNLGFNSSMQVVLNNGAVVNLNYVSGDILYGNYRVGANQLISNLTVSSIQSAYIVDKVGNVSTSFTVPSSPLNIADTATVAIVKRDITPTLDAGECPINLTTLGSNVYVTNSCDSTVSIINTADNNSMSTVSVGSNPRSITTLGTKVYVANLDDNTISIIDTADNNSVTTVSVGFAPIALTTLGTKVYVSNYNDSNVSIIDTADNNSVTNVAVGSYPYALTTLGTKVYVANSNDNTVSIIDTADNNSVTNVAVGSYPYALTTLGTKVYVANLSDNTVSIIDTANNNTVSTVSVGVTPQAITTLGTKVYVANTNSSNVSIIDTANNNSVTTVSVGLDPIALTTLGTKVYVANNSSNNVSIIDTALPVVPTLTLQTSTYTNNTVSLTYSLPLNTSSVPLPTDFSVFINGATTTPSAVSVLGSVVFLTLPVSPPSTSTVTLNYKVGTRPIKDTTTLVGSSYTNQPLTYVAPVVVPVVQNTGGQRTGGGGGGGGFSTPAVSTSSSTVTIPVASIPSLASSTPGAALPTTLQSGTGGQSLFIRTLTVNSIDTEVQRLQSFLNTQGFSVSKTGAGSPGKETNKFGPATKAALIKFQKAHGIKPAIGFFGPVTRKVVNGMVGR